MRPSLQIEPDPNESRIESSRLKEHDPRGRGGYISGVAITGSQTLRVAPAEGEGVRVLAGNEELLERYLAGRVLSPKTRRNYETALRSFAALARVPLEDASGADLAAWYAQVRIRARAASTIALYALLLGKLLEHALGERGLARDEARVRARKIMEGVPAADLHREAARASAPRDMLVTPAERAALLDAAPAPWPRVLIEVLIESACRKGELLSLRVRDVTRRPRYTEMRVHGKTGERTIPLVRSAPILDRWLEVHPDPRLSAPLFTAVSEGEALKINAGTPNDVLRDLCARAGLRHIHPHMFRHTRLTELAMAGIGEYQLKSFAGWTRNSGMAARYIHLSGRAHIEAILRADGVTLEEVHGEAEG